MGLNWGMAGYGWVAREFMAPAIIAAGGRTIAVADTSSSAREQAQADGIATYGSIAELLERTRPDAIYVATPNNRHAEAVIAAARLGVPVLCEKPMAASLADAEAMHAAVVSGPSLYATAFDQRHHPAHRMMRDLVADGDIGMPVAVRIVYACWVYPAWSATGSQAENWRADPKAAGGGAVIDLALHGLDLTQMLLGEPLTRLSIDLQRRVHDYAVDDGGMLTARSQHGVLVSQHVAYNCPEALPRRRLEVIGESGMLVAIDTMGQSPGGSLTRLCGKTGQAAEIPFDTLASPFAAQAMAFSAAVAGAPHDFCADRDIALMRLFDTAYKEAQSCL